MGWKNPLSSFFARGESKASKTAALLVQWGGGQPRFTPRQYDQLASEGYQKNVIV